MQFTSAAILEIGEQGMVEGLAAQGFVENRTVVLDRFNAQGDLPTVNSMAHGIIEGGYKLALTITTPCLQSFAAVNRAGKVVHIFGIVTDPFSAGIGLVEGQALAHPEHLTGIGTFDPVDETFVLAKTIYPGLKHVGTIWNPSDSSSQTTVALARRAAGRLGIELTEAQIENSAGLKQAADSLLTRGVEALWLATDNLVELGAESIIQSALAAGVPAFSNSPGHIYFGALFSLGADWREVGKITGDLAGRVLKGLNPGQVPIENVVPKQLALNLSVVDRLKDHWEVSSDLIAQAALLVGKDGRKTEPKGGKAENTKQ